MLWFEEYEVLMTMLLVEEGSICSLVMSEACGYYVQIEVFGESSKSLVTKDYSNKADAIGVAMAWVEAWC